jgi:TPR repeat protein
MVEEIMKRVAANDAASINLLGNLYENGLLGLQQDRAKAMELYARAMDLGNTKAHRGLGGIYHQRGDMKKAKFHYEAAAMAGDEVSRNNLGMMEVNLGNVERAVKHWAIAASAGCYHAMHQLTVFYEKGYVRRESIIVMLVVSKKGHGHVSRESINSTLTAYNNSCVEMRSEARDACIRFKTEICIETI